MNIVIAGAGMVGYALARELSASHNVIIIDKDSSKLSNISDSLDVLAINGDSEDPAVYSDISDDIDLFIAVTDLDEVNILSTFVADTVLNIKTRFIRLRSNKFQDSPILDRLNIDKAFFSLNFTAKKVASLFEYPFANNVKSFNNCSYKLFSLRVFLDKENPKEYKVAEFNNENSIVVGVERKKELKFLLANDNIKQNDLIYFLSTSQMANSFANRLKKVSSTYKKVAIFGVNKQSIKIAKELQNFSLDISMIGSDKNLCHNANDILHGRVEVFCNNIDGKSIFDEDTIRDCDVFIATSDDNEENIIHCMEAKELGISKVITISNDNNYYTLMHKLGITVVRGGRVNTYYEIIESITSTKVINVVYYCGGHGVLMFRRVNPNSKLIEKRVKGRENFYIIRNQIVLNDLSSCSYQEDDMLVLFGDISDKEELYKWINTL